jgi:hypothetical protein
MRTTMALLVLLTLALPGVAMPHPCEAEVAQMRKDLESIRKAVATLGSASPSELQGQMLKGAKEKYEAELRRTTEAEARCERLVQEANPGAAPPAASAAAAGAVPEAAPAAPSAAAAPPAPAPAPASAPVPAPAAAPSPIPAPVTASAAPPAPAVPVSPAVEPVRPVAPPPAAVAPGAVVTPAAPCLTGCGKDTDCKGDRICVKGECVDPPARKSPSR